VYTIDDIEKILNEIADEIPDEFFKHLNGGVVLLDRCEALSQDGVKLCTLGEYHHDSLGRWICIYYGSFMRLYSDVSEDVLRKELRETVFHEFTHHLESLAGERGLEIKDEIRMKEYLKNTSNKK
jgi:predicted Zn-dependent protease with MMP-like domain